MRNAYQQLPTITPEMIKHCAENIDESVEEALDTLHYNMCHSPDRERPLQRPVVCRDPDCRYRI